MKTNRKHIGIKSIKNSLKRKALSIVLTLSLIFSCFAPATSAFAKTAGTNQTTNESNVASLEGRNSLKGFFLEKVIPDLKTPLVNPVQVIVNQIYQKLIGPGQTFIENELSEALNWILGIEPEAKRDPNAQLTEIQRQIKDLDTTIRDGFTKIDNAIKELKDENAKKPVRDAIQAAQTLFDQKLHSSEITTIDINIVNYNNAKKAGDKEGMWKALHNIAMVDGVHIVKGKGSTNSYLEKVYLSLWSLSINTGGYADLEKLFQTSLKSKKSVDTVLDSYGSLYLPFIEYMNRINEYQVISLTALREHERLSDELHKEKLVSSVSDSDMQEWIKRMKKRTLNMMQDNLANNNRRIQNIPNLTVTFTYSNNEVETVRYHSFADAWVDAQRDNKVVSAKITLYSDFVYNGEKKNYYGDEIEPGNRNMKFDLTLDQYGDDSVGFFKNGNLNVKSGKNIQLDLSSHVLANLKSDMPTISVENGATLNLISAPSEIDGRIEKRGQIGGVKYENGSAGCVCNVKFADKYSFNKYEIKLAQKEIKVNPGDTSLQQIVNEQNNLQTNATYLKYEYKEFKDVEGKKRNTAAILNEGATKNFEVLECDFLGLENTGKNYGAGIEVCSSDNLKKTDDEGNITEHCAAMDVKDCYFVSCKANKGAAISTTKHINVVDSVFNGCEAKEDGGAIFKYQTEGDTKDLPAEYKDEHIKRKYDKEASTFLNCTFSKNISNQKGGAINILGNLNIQNSTFTNNEAVQGGAVFEIVRRNAVHEGPSSDVYEYFYNVNLTNSNFDDNSANRRGNIENNGGAVCVEGGKVISNANTFTNNKAQHDGGAVCQMLNRQYTLAPEADYQNTSFSKNSADNYGGAIKIHSRANITDVKITENYAQNYGGGIFCDELNSRENGSSLKRVTITNNKCKNGRGAGLLIHKEIYLHENLTIKDNYRDNGEASDLHALNLSEQCIFPENGFCQGGSYVGLDLNGQSILITDKRTKKDNWFGRINDAKQYLHMNDGRSIVENTRGTWFWQKWWLEAR